MSNHDHNHHEDNAQDFMTKIEFLDSTMRQRMLPPEQILGMLPMQKEDNVLDVGAGTGYFTIPVAKKTEGSVFALDMDERMLQVIETKAKSEKIPNIQLIQGNIENIPLPESSVDIAIASLILHEVRALPAVLVEINRVLKAGGYLLCLEYEKKENNMEGPPMHVRIPSVDMERSLIAAGFAVDQKAALTEPVYIIIAKKTRDTAQ